MSDLFPASTMTADTHAADEGSGLQVTIIHIEFPARQQTIPTEPQQGSQGNAGFVQTCLPEGGQYSAEPGFAATVKSCVHDG